MKTLFIDFDGTICHDRFWQNLPKDKREQVQQILFVENFLMVIDWMLGGYTSEEVNHFIAGNTGIPYEYLWLNFVEGCQNMKIKKEDLNLIQSLRKHYHVVLVTGNMDCFDRFTVPALSLNKYFHVIVNSYREHKIKTDDNGATFLKYLKGDIKNAVLIENSKDACQVFSSLGGTALNVNTKTTATDHLQNLLKSAQS